MLNAYVLNVFISSPSDTSDERSMIKDSIYRWNLLNYERERIILNVVNFQENAYAILGTRPQGALNSQLLKNADILIGVFWQRIGTPTEDESGHQYISGSAEEIERHINANKPAMLFFSKKALPQDYDRNQFEKLQEFRNQYMNKGLICEFNDHENPFFNHISLLMNGNEVKKLLQSQIYKIPSSLAILDSRKIRFEWYFEEGILGKRIWYKDSKYRWRETAEGIEDKCFLCVEESYLHEERGIVVQSMSPHDKFGFQIFIPNKNSKDMRLYWRIVHELNNTWQILGISEITYY